MPIINYTGSSAAAVFAAGVINSAADIAEVKMNQVNTYATQAVNAVGDAPTLTPIVPPTISTTGITRSDVDTLRTTMLGEMDDGQVAVATDLADKFSGFLTSHFPWSAELTAAQAWVNRALTSGGTGLAAAIEAQIWERDRARLEAEAARAEEEATALWAARRYPLPPGAATAQVMQIRQDLRNSLAQSSREVAIKQAELELDNIKFAVSTVVDFRKAAIQAALEYLARMTFAYTFPAEKVVQSAQGAAALEQAVANYFNAEVSLKELAIKSAQMIYQTQIQVEKDQADIDLAFVKEKVGALTNAMQAVSVQAAATLNALHASVGYTGAE